MKQAFKITIKGKVQNVGFRFSTVQKAQENQITGFVRNQPDGTVYIEAEGDAQNLNRFMEWCKEGPPAAKVKDMEKEEIPLQEFSNFHVK